MTGMSADFRIKIDRDLFAFISFFHDVSSPFLCTLVAFHILDSIPVYDMKKALPDKSPEVLELD
jgi:hypothetical protein